MYLYGRTVSAATRQVKVFSSKVRQLDHATEKKLQAGQVESFCGTITATLAPNTIMQIDEELTFKKLEIFLAFMRSGNLSRAAAELDTSTVSVHRTLCTRWRTPCAARCSSARGASSARWKAPTCWRNRAQKLVADMLDTVCLTREAAGFSAERFKLGALYSLTVKTVPQLIMGLKLRRSELILGSNVDLLYKLKNLELDAILLSLNDSMSDPDCESLPLFSDDIFLAVPSDSPFAGQAEVDLAELREATFITLTQGFATHQDAQRVFQQASWRT